MEPEELELNNNKNKTPTILLTIFFCVAFIITARLWFTMVYDSYSIYPRAYAPSSIEDVLYR